MFVEMTKTRQPLALSAMERLHWEAQQENAPPGHKVAGPFRRGQIWRCLGCSQLWSDGVHPKMTDEELEISYPFNA